MSTPENIPIVRVAVTEDDIFVRSQRVADQAPPVIATGPIGWMRANLFSSPMNAVLTILVIALLVWVIPPLVRFLIIDATWSGSDRTACLGPEQGACWAFVWDRLSFFIYG